MSSDPAELIGQQVLLPEGPGYVEAYDLHAELFVVDLHDSRRSFRMREDEVHDAIRAHQEAAS